jgi:hypothetical protein
MPEMCRKGRAVCCDAVLLVQREREVEQARLLVADQPRQGDGGAHVRERVVRRLVRDAVGLGEVFELETGLAAHLAALVPRPFDAVRAQRVGHAHHVEQIPAAALVLPLARVGIDEVAPEHEARDLVVEADGVVAHADGAGPGQLGLDAGGELVLGHALFQAELRRDAGDQAGLGAGQVVGCGLAVEHQRLADLVQIGIGADGCELRGTVAARVGAEGFVVVPEEGVHEGTVAAGNKAKPEYAWPAPSQWAPCVLCFCPPP